jgi:ribosomal protein S18 acetylase RimI-like enzyme
MKPTGREKPALVDFSIAEFGPDDDRDLADVVLLHMELLDYGPMAGLGPRFIREVGYRLHMQEGVLKVAICRAGSEVAGFVAYTSRSISFHRQSLGAHFFRIGWILLLSLLEDPRRLSKLVRALKVVASRRSEVRRGEDPMGEIVAIAVRRAFLKRGIVDHKGKRVSSALVDYCMGRLRAEGAENMRMLVDADNKSALFLYHGMGARMEEYEQAGEPMVEVWFDLMPRAGETEPGAG